MNLMLACESTEIDLKPPEENRFEKEQCYDQEDTHGHNMGQDMLKEVDFFHFRDLEVAK